MEYVFLAILNGVIIATARTINGSLSVYVGPFRASLWNHLVGVLFVTVIMLITLQVDVFHYIHGIPLYAYLGGVFGAVFVAINSYVFTRLGATKTILLVIGGQMITGVLIEYANTTSLLLVGKLLGVAMIVYGLYLSKSA